MGVSSLLLQPPSVIEPTAKTSSSLLRAQARYEETGTIIHHSTIICLSYHSKRNYSEPGYSIFKEEGVYPPIFK
jgi:hypothetical protein